MTGDNRCLLRSDQMRSDECLVTRSDSLLLGLTTGMHGVVRETKPSQIFHFGNFTPAFLSLSLTTYLKHPLRIKVLLDKTDIVAFRVSPGTLAEGTENQSR